MWLYEDVLDVFTSYVVNFAERLQRTVLNHIVSSFLLK